MNYLFMTNHGSNEHPELAVQPFDASTELNDYEVSHGFFPPPLSHLAPHSFISTPIGRCVCACVILILLFFLHPFHRSPGRYAI